MVFEIAPSIATKAGDVPSFNNNQYQVGSFKLASWPKQNAWCYFPLQSATAFDSQDILLILSLLGTTAHT